jgi:hypothetical protein
MKKDRRSLLLAVLVMVGLISLPLQAAGIVHITGGGQGTFGFDLDADGDTDGSHFGMGVDILGGGAAQGHFTCLMAGNKAFLGLHLMLVEGQVDVGTANSSAGTGSFSGSGTLHINNDKEDVTFVVHILHGGGPGVGQFQLTVYDSSGSLIVAFPPEMVESGQIMIH